MLCGIRFAIFGFPGLPYVVLTDCLTVWLVCGMFWRACWLFVVLFNWLFTGALVLVVSIGFIVCKFNSVDLYAA